MIKKILQKIKFSLVAAFLPLVTGYIFVVPASAACGQLVNPLDPNCKGTPSIGDIVSGFIPLIPILIGMILFAMIALGSIQVVVSGPSDDGKKKGIQTIQNAIIGVIILVSSVGIVSLIEAITGAKLLYGVSIGR